MLYLLCWSDILLIRMTLGCLYWTMRRSRTVNGSHPTLAMFLLTESHFFLSFQSHPRCPRVTASDRWSKYQYLPVAMDPCEIAVKTSRRGKILRGIAVPQSPG